MKFILFVLVVGGIGYYAYKAKQMVSQLVIL